MPHAQFSKVLSELKQAGIKDADAVSRIRWDIIGVQTTWKPLLVITSAHSILMLVLTVYAGSRREMKTRPSKKASH
jgi:hypothetical protein